MSAAAMVHRAASRVARVPGVMAFGHYGWPVPVGLLIGMRCTTPTWQAALTWGLPLEAAAVAVAVHGSLLASCGRCRARLTPAGPDQAGEQVARYRWLLRMVHAPWRSLTLWTLTTAAVALTYLADGQWRPWSALPAAGVLVAGLVWAPRVHLCLAAACPWCGHGHGRGGDDPDQAGPPPSDPGGRGQGEPRVEEVVPAVTADRQTVPDHCDDLIAEWAGLPPAHDPQRDPARTSRVVPGQRKAGGAL